MTYDIKQVASILGISQTNLFHAELSILLTDSRKLANPSDTLFFALQTNRNDAHNYITDLYNSGVRNFVVTKIQSEWSDFENTNFLIVKNSLTALQKLATYHRSKYKIPVIGITGSNGKTIVKEWLYQLLEKDFNITRSPRSFNSQLGVPLSVWQLSDEAELGIFEAGISMPDEMELLEPIIKPTIGLLTKIGEAHQENFSSLQQKIMEKLELFINCEVLIFDEDNDLVSRCVDQMVLSQKTFTWSRKNSDSHLYISQIKINEDSTKISYSFMNFQYDFVIPFIDDASIENAINCLAVALYLHVPPKEIVERMFKLEPVAMRLDVRKGKRGCLIINDTYNSDINSIKIALDFQEQRKLNHSLKKTIVLSDILQTGVLPKTLYKRVSEMLDLSGVTRLIGVGRDITANAELFNMAEKSFFLTTEEFVQSEIIDSFQNELILLKGARRFNFEYINSLIEERIHETVLEVDLDALVHNFNFYKSMIHPSVKIICMVKANGYGSGAAEIAKTLQYHRCDYLAVAVAEEGVMLRQEGITLPIIVLNPEVNAFEELYTYDLEPEIYSFRILEAFIKESERRGVTDYPTHLKIDTGMHRLGFVPQQLNDLIAIIKKQKGLKIKSVFSHLSASESRAFDDFTQKRIKVFNESAQLIENELNYKVYKHILNSAGIERFSDTEGEMVRLGIGLYGISPSNVKGLRNVCTLKSTILQIKEIPTNETIGYGRKELLSHDARIATIRFGYADGMNRLFGNRKGKVVINGQLAQIVGNICMDLCMVDVTGIEANEGDTVTLFGDKLSVIDLANSIDTIPYEILTSVSYRVKRVYIKE